MPRRILITTATGRRLLAGSRNRFPSGEYEMIAAAKNFVAACIEIEDRLLVQAYSTIDTPFRALAGIPAAHAFLMEWYNSEADAMARQNRLTTNVPAVRFEPATPYPLGEEWFDGIVSITWNREPGSLYGNLCILQEIEI